MNNIQLPRITNVYFTPGSKVALLLNQPKHLVALMVRRGSNQICFKLTAEYCNKFLPEAYNNSLLDVNLASGVVKVYPKARKIPEVSAAVHEIAQVFCNAGLVVEIVEN